ncbi:hypothetical protein Golomagni_05876 [Golovinomyces magnicellulatus]|nr:hypothetical protein Golomagni_05876 [Golovinomyces magnicellulatus]
MEENLNKIRQLNDDLCKKVRLPKQVIIAWVLNNLIGDFDIIDSSITPSLRTDVRSYNIEKLFSNLLDEPKRPSSLNPSRDTVMLVSTGGEKLQRYHSVSKNKTIFRMAITARKLQLQKQIQKTKTSSIEEVDNLLISHENETDQLIDFNTMDLDLNLGQNQSSTTIPHDKRNSELMPSTITNFAFTLQHDGHSSNKFTVDTAAMKNSVSNIQLYFTFN